MSKERDPDIFQALIDLRPVFLALRKAKYQLGLEAVRSNLSDLSSVTAQLKDARSRIHTRAGRIGISSDALTAILSVDASEKARIRRRPSLRQMDVALWNEYSASCRRVAAAKDRLAAAEAELTAALRAEAASSAACLAFTGNPK